MEETTPATATIIVRFIRLHVDEIFLAHYGLHNKPKIIGYGIAEALANDLAGVLDGEFDTQVLVPVGVDFQFSFTDPFCVIFIDVLDLEVMLEIEFCQSGPD